MSRVLVPRLQWVLLLRKTKKRGDFQMSSFVSAVICLKIHKCNHCYKNCPFLQSSILHLHPPKLPLDLELCCTARHYLENWLEPDTHTVFTHTHTHAHAGLWAHEVEIRILSGNRRESMCSCFLSLQTRLVSIHSSSQIKLQPRKAASSHARHKSSCSSVD